MVEPAAALCAGMDPADADVEQLASVAQAKAGLRAYIVRLEPGESGAPDLLHKGAELVVVASGLVQLTIGDTPGMRVGDAVLPPASRRLAEPHELPGAAPLGAEGLAGIHKHS